MSDLAVNFPQNKDFTKELEAKIDKFIKGLQNLKEKECVKRSDIPNDLQGYFAASLHCKNLLEYYKNEGLEQGNEEILKGFIAEIDEFLDREIVLHLAIIGAVKAGKSTLINTLLKQDVAPMNSKPETSTITKFRYADTDYFKVVFYDKEDWKEVKKDIEKSGLYSELNAQELELTHIGKAPIKKELPLNDLIQEIQEYISSQGRAQFFVKEVEIGIRGFPFSKNIILVDTPGLDDPVKYRVKATKEYIDKSIATIVCVNSEAMRGSELDIIQKVFDNTNGKPHKVFIAGTKIDRLNDPINEWEAHKKLWINHTSDESAEKTKYNKELANTNILGISAYVARLCDKFKEESTNEKEVKDLEGAYDKIFGGESKSFISKAKKFFSDSLDDKDLKELQDFSNVNTLYNAIKEKIEADAQNAIREEIKLGYNKIKEPIEDFLKEKQKSLAETYEDAKKDAKEIEQKMSELEQEAAEYIKGIKKISEIIDSLSKESEKAIKTKMDSIKNNILSPAREKLLKAARELLN